MIPVLKLCDLEVTWICLSVSSQSVTAQKLTAPCHRRFKEQIVRHYLRSSPFALLCSDTQIALKGHQPVEEGQEYLTFLCSQCPSLVNELAVGRGSAAVVPLR